jgi:hypothetical protein
MLTEIEILPPVVTATEPHFSRSPVHYKHVTSAEIVTAMKGADFVLTRINERRVRKADRQGFQKHVMRFSHKRDLETFQARGTERPEIVISNSHDGTSAVDVLAGIFRLVCSNGMVVKSADFGSLKFPHRGPNLTDRVLIGAWQIAQRMPEIEDRMNRFKGTYLSPMTQLDFAHEAAFIRWGGERDMWPVYDPAHLLAPRRGDDIGPDLWRVFNVVQENMTRGGIRGHNKAGEIRTVRAIRSPEADLIFNARLWELADRYAKGDRP